MAQILKVEPSALTAIKNFHLPEVKGFGQIHAPVMIECDYLNQSWQELKLLPYGPISLDPSCKVFHYGQEIFEGIKAYKVDSPQPQLFRPEENFKRFNLSAERVGMPTLPRHYFFESLETIVGYCEKFIPSLSGQSLYLRPFMFATEPFLGIQPSTMYKFMVVASPTASYFAGDVHVLIERSYSRAAPGGTGFAKAGGNYAASLISSLKAKKYNLQQVLWLDACEKKYAEELSGMNFFAVIDNTLVTPPLTDTILAGITRDSIIRLAPSLGLKVREEKIEIKKLLQQIQSGACTETFACGTASIITPIQSLNEESGEKYPLPESNGPVTQLIRKTILDIQEGRTKGPDGWIHQVPGIKN